MINTAKGEAQSEANKILSQAQEAIQNEKRTAVNELKDHVSSIALDIATKVLQNELESKDKQMQLVSKLLQDSDMK
jgi:F-type H+-transporting ATPase subunit b